MRLLYLDSEGIDKLVKEYEIDIKAIRSELFKLCWFMRGGLSLTEAFSLTPEDRELIAAMVESNLAVTQETGIPFF